MCAIGKNEPNILREQWNGNLNALKSQSDAISINDARYIHMFAGFFFSITHYWMFPFSNLLNVPDKLEKSI